MRKIRIMEHISLDGVIDQGEEDAYGGWTTPYRTPTGAAALAEAQGKGFDLLLGRRTYDLWASFWPEVKGGPFADSLNTATKYVATHRPDSLEWGPVGNLGADVVEGVRRLKSQDGPDLIVWGSTTLTSMLFGQGLVDEVVLIVYPVLLGQGKRFFSDSAAPRELALVSTKATPTGVLINTYRHVGSLATKSVVGAGSCRKASLSISRLSSSRSKNSPPCGGSGWPGLVVGKFGAQAHGLVSELSWSEASSEYLYSIIWALNVTSTMFTSAHLRGRDLLRVDALPSKDLCR